MGVRADPRGDRLSRAVLHVRLTPRAAADRIDGWTEDAAGRPVLNARVRAAPVEGEANAALEALLGRALGLARSAVSVARGGASRLKAVSIEGIDAAEARRRLGEG